MLRPASATGTFFDIFGESRVRAEAADRARLRIDTHRGHQNIVGTVHGGFLMALADQALFICPTALGHDVLGGVTVDASCQFIGAGRIGTPLDAVVEVLRETGRMLFARGLIEQEGTVVMAFTGTLRKPR
ncbi:PaaI family thioesterase [Sphingomonas sp.]|uniref:PaaI family thioesterase n=1 Tax=Sphingomonas sp. TaxID=28214 RepID=UPI000DB8585D|nr:PaaI family thioesterase [Sphingomonas sp.]PZU08713.1 MAG: PaaI family thioesterase [Sphingomonas sp.]